MYELFILDGGTEVRETAELVDRLVDNKVQPFISKVETWIQSTITLR